MTALRLGLERAGLIVCGGKGSEPRVWDLEHPDRPIFKARAVKAGAAKLYIQAPKHVAALAWVPGTNDTTFLAATAHKELRLYDTRAQSRPVYDAIVSEHAIKTISVAADGTTAVIGDVAGGVAAFDVRTAKRLGHYRGFTGSCRQVVCHPTLPVMGCVGLDRHFRLYDVNSRQLLKQTYLKQRLSAILLRSRPYGADSDSGDDDGGAAPDSAAADVWDSLPLADAAGAPPKKAKAKRRKEDAEVAESKKRKKKRDRD